MMGRFGLALLGVLLIFAGGFVAARVQTSDGVEIRDIRIPIGEDKLLAGYLYVPQTATQATPAPGILAVHGYINSRETQSAFAIELARRGYVVLAIDQSGHGFSTNLAFEEGFGGPAGVSYLRALPFVDPDRIGLEGHSMGGWTALAAADVLPDAYTSIALVGSSVGTRAVPAGTPDWPRNVAVIFSQYDEFSELMWEVDKSANVAESQKLQTLFNTDTLVEPGRIYGDLAAGTARLLTQPAATHPGDHLSQDAIGDVIDWMETTIGAPAPKPRTDQIWMWKEAGTTAALIGVAALVLGLLAAGPTQAAPGQTAPGQAAEGASSRLRWWLTLAVSVILPAALFFPATQLGLLLVPQPFLTQNITTQIMTWALVNGVVALIGILLAPRITARPAGVGVVFGALVVGLIGVGLAYGLVTLSGMVFQSDMRFWVVALKPMGAHHLDPFLIYLLPFTLFFILSHWAMEKSLLSSAKGAFGQYVTGWLASAGGMAILIGTAYSVLFATGSLPPGFDPLFTIIGIQFVPVLTLTGLLAVTALRRTGSTLPGAVVSGVLITWYITAGQAIHG